MAGLTYPSYAQGFASCAAESEAPGLWRGLKGLWVPHLGPTGAKLIDLGPYRNNAAIATGGFKEHVLATSWINDAGIWAIESDVATNERAEVPALSSQLNVTNITLLIYFRSKDQPNFAGPVGRSQGGDQSYYLDFHTEAPRIHMSISGTVRTVTGTGFAGDGEIHIVVGTYDGATLSLYVDGVLDNSGNWSGAVDSSAEGLAIGSVETGANSYPGTIYQVGLWGRPLFPSELRKHAADPFALTRLRARTLVKAPPVGTVARHLIQAYRRAG